MSFEKNERGRCCDDPADDGNSSPRKRIHLGEDGYDDTDDKDDRK